MNEKCPFCGLEDDPETAATFPTDRNRCYRLAKPKSVSLDQQSSYCLSSNYPACIIYQNEQPARLALPALPSSSAILTNPFFRPLTVIAVAFLAMLGLFFYARSIWGNNLTVSLFANEFSRYTLTRPSDTPTSRPTLVPSATHFVPLPTFTPTFTLSPTATGTDTPVPTVMAVTETAAASPTDSSSAGTRIPPTRTSLPTVTVCSRPPYGWISYTIRFGDSLNSIAVAYGTSISQLQSANCMGNSIIIYAGNTLYVPYVATHVAISTNTPLPAPTKTRRPPSTNSPIPPASNTPIPPPSDTPIPPPSDTPIPPASTDTTAPYPSG